MQMDVLGRKNRGWPMETWRELVEEDWRLKDMTVDAAQNRVKWKRQQSHLSVKKKKMKKYFTSVKDAIVALYS